MRVSVSEYAEGGRAAHETTNDGGVLIGEWTGPHRAGVRLAAFVEVAYDETVEGSVDRLLEALDWLSEEIKKRKGAAVQV